MGNVLAVAIIVVIVGSAAGYVIHHKRRGNVKCIGCPYGASCHGNCNKKK